MFRRPVFIVGVVAMLTAQTSCAALAELGPPRTSQEHYLPPGTEPHRLRITVAPDPAVHEGKAALECVERCTEWATSPAAHGRCIAACPTAEVTWDARCDAAKGATCFEYIAVKPVRAESDVDRDSVAGDIALGGLAVVGMITAAGVVNELCDQHSSDPNCGQNERKLAPPR